MSFYIEVHLNSTGVSSVSRPRDKRIERLRDLLERSGFYVTGTSGVRPSSFDLAARRDATLLLLKILKNIDALDPDEASRLLELGRVFPAVVLLVGERSGASDLESGVVYTRYGVPIVNEATLQEYLEKAFPPFLYASPGGIFARIDGERLRFLRVTRGLSLGSLAAVGGVSRRAIQLYEEGQGAEASVVERIEAYLDAPIVIPIELFGPPPARPVGTPPTRRRRAASSRPPILPGPRRGDALRDGVFDQLDGMGLEVTVTVRAPFDAVARRPRDPAHGRREPADRGSSGGGSARNRPGGRGTRDVHRARGCPPPFDRRPSDPERQGAPAPSGPGRAPRRSSRSAKARDPRRGLRPARTSCSSRRSGVSPPRPRRWAPTLDAFAPEAVGLGVSPRRS